MNDMTQQNKSLITFKRDWHQQLIDFFTTEVDSDYLLMGLPYHGNLGDSLIWQGEEDILSHLPHKCKFRCGSDIRSLKYAPINKNYIILLHGGGNFGDIWPKENDFRNAVITKYPDNKIIILPQTIYYNDIENLKKDSILYAAHPNVKICVRDNMSLQTALRYFKNNGPVLLPDMAFGISSHNLKVTDNAEGSIFVMRNDKELSRLPDYTIVPNTVVRRDWPTMDGTKLIYKIRDKVMLIPGILDKMFKCHLRLRLSDYFNYHFILKYNVHTAIKFISKFDIIYSTRMHAAILALILEKNNIVLFDNSYGKSASVCETWFKDIDNIRLVK